MREIVKEEQISGIIHLRKKVVYIVSYRYRDGGHNIHAVFSTRELAEELARKVGFHVEEWEVDKYAHADKETAMKVAYEW